MTASPVTTTLLLRKIDEDVALRVGAPEEEEMDLAVPLERSACVRSKAIVGRAGPEGADLGQVLLGLAEVRAELRALVGAGGGGELGAQSLDLAGHLAHVVLDALEALPDDRLARDVVRDHLDVAVGGGIRLVALPVVPVEVGVDDVAHGLRRDRPDPLDDGARGRGLRVRIDDQDAVVGLDERGVAVDLVRARGHGDVDAVRHLLDVEERVVAARAAVDHDETSAGPGCEAEAAAPTGLPPDRRLGQYNRAGGAQRLMVEAPGPGSLKARLVLPLSLLVSVVAVGTLGYRWLWRGSAARGSTPCS